MKSFGQHYSLWNYVPVALVYLHRHQSTAEGWLLVSPCLWASEDGWGTLLWPFLGSTSWALAFWKYCLDSVLVIGLLQWRSFLFFGLKVSMGSWAAPPFPCQSSSVVLSNNLRAMYLFLPREFAFADKGVVFFVRAVSVAAVKVSQPLVFSKEVWIKVYYFLQSFSLVVWCLVHIDLYFHDLVGNGWHFPGLEALWRGNLSILIIYLCVFSLQVLLISRPPVWDITFICFYHPLNP